MKGKQLFQSSIGQVVHSIAQNTEQKQGRRVIHGAPEGQDARILAGLARELMRSDRVLVHIALDDARIALLEELLAFFAPDVRVIRFPAWDCLPYDRASPHGDIVATRVSSLRKMLEWRGESARYPRLVLTSVNAALQRVMPAEVLQSASFQIRKGQKLDLEDFRAFLARNGYVRTDTVRDAGDFAIRGGIVDLYPSGAERPVRIDMFGEEAESIRAFDPATQLTESELKDIILMPASELFLDEESIARFRASYREIFGVAGGNDPLYEAVSSGRRYNGMEHWLPLFHERLETLFDYLPGAQVGFDYHAMDAHDERIVQIRDFFQARKTLESAAAKKNGKAKDVSLSGSVYHPLPVQKLYIEDVEWRGRVADAFALSLFGSPAEEGEKQARKGRDFADVRALPDGDVFGALLNHVRDLRDGRTILIACYSEGSRTRILGLLENSGFGDVKVCENYEDVKKIKSYQTGLVILPLAHGFVADDLVVITEQDILGDRLTRKAKKRRKADNFLTEISALSEGDLVVHVDHGIGRFVQLETLKAAGTVHDFLKLEYAGGDRLYVPVENIEVLSRFGSDEGTVQLDKLGGAGWQARKAKAKKNLMEMAHGLLKIAAERQLTRAEKLHVGDESYNEFAARFPYRETEDQERAIDSVLEGIGRDLPMDHLVCGDVGFGKTEVALRAAYVATRSGAQVAVVVPTTLLARQHYKNFETRFAGTGIRIAQLSRLVNAKDAKAVRDGLADGSVSVVIGTHALFASAVKFSNLGLLIVDEEQRFGVKQKERLKELKANVHVLTLTATPIPRTLQLSLAGVKDMSLITTPPVDRLAVRTFVMPFDSVVVRDALLREHYRGGQSFYVVPRVSDIAEIEELLKELVPEVKVIAAHGQLSPTDLEDRMTAFYDGQYDVLLATNIIESGIDIPSANTMVIHRADMFGLAQLYQLRGRIGRSKVRSYAYLTYSASKALNLQAQKRLEVMESLDTLGSGFQLASHDMDIRGAGNLLGDQQSGHIREIGVELYQQMLEEAVAAAREGANFESLPDEHWSPAINMGVSVLIPEVYVEDLSVRMSLYRRLTDLESDSDLEGFAAELIDRFGKLPEEVENLLKTLSIKLLCKKAGVAQLDAGPKGAVIRFHENKPPNVPGLMRWVQEKRGALKLRPDQKLVAMRDWHTPAQRIKGAESLMKELAGL